MIDFTHMLFGLALAYLLDFPVVYGMVGAVFPDIDILFQYGFPFTHRGVVHTPAAVLFVMVVLALVTNRRSVAYGFGIGYLSHLFLDTFTYTGIRWLYPVTTQYSLELIAYDSMVANIGITVLSVAVMLGWHYQEAVTVWMR